MQWLRIRRRNWIRILRRRVFVGRWIQRGFKLLRQPGHDSSTGYVRVGAGNFARGPERNERSDGQAGAGGVVLQGRVELRGDQLLVGGRQAALPDVVWWGECGRPKRFGFAEDGGRERGTGIDVHAATGSGGFWRGGSGTAVKRC